VPLVRERVPSARVIEGDALELDWRAELGLAASDDLLVAGNIPYNITTPLIDAALAPPRPRRIVFLVQREVAERLTGEPGSKAYGALTVGVRAVARVEQLFRVPAGAFTPPPKVDSAVVRFTPLAVPIVPDSQIRRFRRLVVGLFGFRRKQLQRGLRELTGWSPEKVGAMLLTAGLDPTARPETLSPGQFAGLLGNLIDGGWQAD
jgi:16S rRNA (adenine1518-N6/adenine1519-N6)-dimethyltransferase